MRNYFLGLISGASLVAIFAFYLTREAVFPWWWLEDDGRLTAFYRFYDGGDCSVPVERSPEGFQNYLLNRKRYRYEHN